MSEAGLSSNIVPLRGLEGVYGGSVSSTQHWLTLHGWLGDVVAGQSEHCHSGHGPSLILIILHNTEVTVERNPHQTHSWLELTISAITQRHASVLMKVPHTHTRLNGDIDGIHTVGGRGGSCCATSSASSSLTNQMAVWVWAERFGIKYLSVIILTCFNEYAYY